MFENLSLTDCSQLTVCRCVLRDMYKLQKVIKSRFKQQIIDQSSGRGREEGRPRINVDDPNPDNLPGPLRICCKTIEQIDSFKVGSQSSIMDGTSGERRPTYGWWQKGCLYAVGMWVERLNSLKRYSELNDANK